jgi:hypothetical protein
MIFCREWSIPEDFISPQIISISFQRRCTFHLKTEPSINRFSQIPNRGIFVIAVSFATFTAISIRTVSLSPACGTVRDDRNPDSELPDGRLADMTFLSKVVSVKITARAIITSYSIHTK